MHMSWWHSAAQNSLPVLEARVLAKAHSPEIPRLNPLVFGLFAALVRLSWYRRVSPPFHFEDCVPTTAASISHVILIFNWACRQS